MRLADFLPELSKGGLGDLALDSASIRDFGAALTGSMMTPGTLAPCGLTAGAAVRHRLGFIRIPLTSWRSTACRAALHVWVDADRAEYSEDIHNHRYDFVSICLAGQIRHEFYAEATTGAAETYAELRYEGGDCCKASGPDRSTRLTAVGTQDVSAGQHLYLTHDGFHTLHPLTRIAATVQFRSPDRAGLARVLRPVTERSPGDGRAEPTQEETIHALRRLAVELAA